MSAAALLESAQAAGVRLSLAGDKIRVQADREPPSELLAELRAHRAELLAELKAGAPALAPGIAAAYARLRQELAERPTIKTAIEVLHPDSDPVLIALAVRGAGYATLRMPQARYDGFRLLEIVHRWNQP